MSNLQGEETIFDTAIQLPLAERAAFLERACRGNAGLRRSVEALLQVCDSAGSFLSEPALPAASHFVELAMRPTEKAGDRINRYKLLQQIGEGGCGIVYMAEQDSPVRRRVALKVVKLGMDTKRVIARFEAERQALALMDHPNIARVLDAGATETGRPFFVMELVRGIKITDYCDHNKVPMRERLDLFIQVCRAIQHAHQKGIIHRDIKPSNILVTLHDGIAVPKIIDFGIAKATSDQPLTDKTIFTAFEQFVGTPAYMSPEQAEMSGLDIDTRSDVYALGVLLYELLTSRTPFDSKELLAAGLEQMRRTIREREALRPSALLSTMVYGELASAALQRRTDAPRLLHLLGGDLDWIVMKCLEKDRSRRYQTANSLASDVQRHLNNEPIVARPPSGVYRFQKWARRNKAAFATGALVACATICGLVGLLVSNFNITRERNKKDLALKEREAALDSARQSEQAAKQQLFVALQSQARARRYSGQMGQRLESLAALKEAARIHADESLRDDATASLALPDIRPCPSWHVFDKASRRIAFDARYERFASLEENGTISIRSIPDNRELQHLGAEQGPQACANGCSLYFSPDGSFLAERDENWGLHVWRCADGRPVFHLPLECRGEAFSSLGWQLAVGQSGGVVCYDLSNGKELHRWALPQPAHALIFHPDGRKLAVGYATASKVSIYDSADGSLVTDLSTGPCSEQVLVWHPDGRHLAVAGSDPRIQIWDVESKRRVAVLAGHVQQVTFLAFHPEGGLLVSSGWEGVPRLWDPASGRQVIKSPIGVRAQFSEDGKWLGVTWKNTLEAQLLEVTPTVEYRTLFNNPGSVETIYYEGSISPDGRLLAVGMQDGVRFWDLDSRNTIGFLPIGATLSVGFSGDGTGLFTCGAAGFQRWLIHRVNADSNEMRLGPPNTYAVGNAPSRVSQENRGPMAAVISEVAGQMVLLNTTTGAKDPYSMPHERGSYVAQSPDQHWVASAGWHSDEAKLWDAENGKLVHQWTLGRPMTVSFTPDSRELIVSRDEAFIFFDVQTQAETRRIQRDVVLYPSPIAFSPDSKIMALEMAPGIVHLKEIATGRTITKLEDPFGDRATCLVFAPDGTQLVAIARYAVAIHVWDLRAIRAQLKSMGLDWDWPALPAARPGPSPLAQSTALKLQVIER